MNELLRKRQRSACSIYFEHPLSGDEFPDQYLQIIYTSYELHLRYYFQGLAFTGFPYVFHTVGSAIAVKAVAYMKAGGYEQETGRRGFLFHSETGSCRRLFQPEFRQLYILHPGHHSGFLSAQEPAIAKLTETDSETLLYI
ncbi:MAG: hypothetical protein MZV63_46000 [Marinilabiliales bacterium]|nr:hypothetical protein [Marinilabiliales bacterium]